MMSNVPKLRFQEFSGEWKKQKLNQIASKSNSKNKDESICEVFTNSAVNGIVAQRDFFDKDIANQNNLAGYYIVRHNDFIYNPRISTSAPVGPLNRNHLQTGVMSPLYTVFTVKDTSVSLEYLERYFKSSKWFKYMYSIANYGARSDRMSVTNNDFFAMPIPIPSKQEQEKIASFLTSVDTKIELLVRKEELLQQYKKGVMQKIFSQEIRFKADDGSEFPEWEEKKLGEVGKIYQPKTISQTDLTEEGFDVYGANGIIGKYSEYNHEFEQIAITCRGNTCGTVNYTKPKSWITGNAMVVNLDNSKVVNKMFMYYQLSHSNLTYLITGSGQPQITGDIKTHQVLVPCLKEQTKIDNFLSSIDSKIAQVSAQLDSTKAFKKALLQQMFV